MTPESARKAAWAELVRRFDRYSTDISGSGYRPTDRRIPDHHYHGGEYLPHTLRRGGSSIPAGKDTR